MTDESSMDALRQSSYLFGGSSSYLEELYEAYLADPNSVGAQWQESFAKLPKVQDGQDKDVSLNQLRQQFIQFAKEKPSAIVTQAESHDVEHIRKQSHVLQLIQAFRSYGHMLARLDPLETERHNTENVDLSLSAFGLNNDDLNTVFDTNSFAAVSTHKATLKEAYALLQQTYAGTLGIEYMHIADSEQTHWLANRVESIQGIPHFSQDKQRKILAELVAAEGLERYLGNKYVGQKRFSLEGGESLVPMFKEIIDSLSQQNVKEIVIGMAHRGRLNVLINVLGKAPSQLFGEFEGRYIEEDRSGDVKYHLGFSSDVGTSNGPMHLALAFNPSHLEIIAPVVEGSVRARQERRKDTSHNQVVPIIIHGDAAFAGQGVVMETLNMSQARGYCTGGTIHIIINNQIGFTTSNPLDARSTLYCTDIAKMIQAPILHVNSDDPEMVVFAANLAAEFRMKFKKDIVIDLVCYRRHGHNEADEPAATQPVMYAKIKAQPTTVQIYAKKLETAGVVSQSNVDQMIQYYRDELDKGHPVVKLVTNPAAAAFTADWRPFVGQDWTAPANTGVDMTTLKKVAKQLEALPAGFTLQKQVEKEYENRQKMADGELPLNWGFAETMAYATLLEAGHNVRLSGQDCGRGTFSHRHSVLHDMNSDQIYVPLANVSPKAQFIVIDSILSEEGVLGFEYGYATATPNAFTIWEAQFGDFANGAQVVIDQFISSGDQKWGRLCGLTLLLPHGYEGMGPEHSSARLERYLQLCAQHNMQVCVPTTPAQCFHMLRRQVIRPFRKPLIVMTPKSLLRNKLATSSLNELANGEFLNIIPEIDTLSSSEIKRVVLCSGKVYYDLLEQRRATERKDVAIVRIEQLYPFPENELKDLLVQYSHAKDVVWCQEEPMNQGAWYCSQHHLLSCLQPKQRLLYAGRAASASPAVGYLSMHVKQQQALVSEALG